MPAQLHNIIPQNTLGGCQIQPWLVMDQGFFILLFCLFGLPLRAALGPGILLISNGFFQNTECIQPNFKIRYLAFSFKCNAERLG